MLVEVTSTAHYLDVANIPFRSALRQRHLVMAFEPATIPAPCALPIGALDAPTTEAIPTIAATAISTHDGSPFHTSNSLDVPSGKTTRHRTSSGV